MIIKSITLNNYRLYKGENTLSLSSSDEKNIMGHRTKRFFQWLGKMGKRF